MVIREGWTEHPRRTDTATPSPTGSARRPPPTPPSRDILLLPGRPLVAWHQDKGHHLGAAIEPAPSHPLSSYTGGKDKVLFGDRYKLFTMADAARSSAAGDLTPGKKKLGASRSSSSSNNSSSNNSSNNNSSSATGNSGGSSPGKDKVEMQQLAGSASVRSRRKFARSGSASWFNKSFDQAVLNQSTRPTQARSMRRQSSVTDFFQNMLTKSKSHLQDIFSSKKDKPKVKVNSGQEEEVPSSVIGADKNVSLVSGAEGGASPSQSSLDLSLRNADIHKSCPSVYDQEVDPPVDSSAVNVQISLDPGVSDKTAEIPERRRSGEKSKRASPTSMSATMNMFVVTKPTHFRSNSEEVNSANFPLYRRVTKKSSLTFSPSPHEGMSSPSSLSSMTSPNRRNSSSKDAASPARYRAPKIVTLPSHDSSDSADEGRGSRCSNASAPVGGGGRASLTGGTISLLATDDVISRAKRALVKSNSDTFAKLSSSPQPLAKASSDGNCFKKNSVSSLVTSMTSSSSMMIGVTDYLFLGSVEAAYNEPLLCKYGISSMIDMTNISPTLVPAYKKSDCPCACVNKTHFRSKLNIGVDDIEWENLEQYFDEINAFIHGARRKGRRVLVYSYMGQSRAAAAAIQHLMHHFKMPYRDALKVVRSKRPQVKLNSGFVKALTRLEKKLGLEPAKQDEGEVSKQTVKPDESPRVSRGSVENISAPPVVRGAWLEC